MSNIGTTNTGNSVQGPYTVSPRATNADYEPKDSK